jgi:hypothetical protein
MPAEQAKPSRQGSPPAQQKPFSIPQVQSSRHWLRSSSRGETQQLCPNWQGCSLSAQQRRPSIPQSLAKSTSFSQSDPPPAVLFFPREQAPLIIKNPAKKTIKHSIFPAFLSIISNICIVA